jgi:hypothetical protein
MACVRRLHLAVPFGFLFFAGVAHAGQVLRFSEEGTRDGRPTRSALTLSVAPEGVRAEATDLSEPGAPKTAVYLYVTELDRIVPIEPPTGPAISPATIAVLEERARLSGHGRQPGVFTVVPLHSTQTLGKWTCAAWAVRRPGQTAEIVCLADPKALGIGEVTAKNLRRMNDLFVPFVNAMRLAGGDFQESLNTYTLEGGFPVRRFRSKEGVVELDAQLVSVENADLRPSLFRAPEPPPEAASQAAAPAPSRTPPRDRTITLEGWALRGMPDPGRMWTGGDYETAVRLLESAARESAFTLPRENSVVSRALYRRFVDPANLAPARGPGTPDERARAGIGVLSGADRISVVYAAAYRDDGAFGAELAGLMAYTLLAAREVVPIAEAAAAAAPGKDRQRAARLEKAHQALASVVNACLVSLATPGSFGPAERLHLARAVEEHVPSLRAYLPAGDRQDLPARLKRMAAAELDPAVREVLERVRAILAKAA